MPTTRSSKRSSETFQTLEPPKRIRKNPPSVSREPVAQFGISWTSPNPQEPQNPTSDSLILAQLKRAGAQKSTHATVDPAEVQRVLQATPVSTPFEYASPQEFQRTSPILEQVRKINPNYVSIGTQTDDVVMLTPREAADLEERATSSKRSREADDEDDHRSKRAMLTPQPKADRTLWMFPSAASLNAPRTAPAKSFGSPSIRRHGPISRTPLSRRRNGAVRGPIRTPHMIAPASNNDAETKHENESSAQATRNNEEENNAQPITPTRKSSGLFGSVRGLAATGLNFISHLSPIRSSAKPVSPSPSTKPKTRLLANQPTVEEDEDDENTNQEQLYPELNNNPDTATEDVRPVRPAQPEAPGMYDHLHIYTDDNFPQERLKFPPRAPSPVDEVQLLKKNHPNMPESHLRRIVDKRKAEREDRDKHLGIEASESSLSKAPLFGPDSHYARGTVDPTNFLEKPLCMYSEEELRRGPQKRKYDTADITTSGTESHGAIRDEIGEANENDEDNEVDTEDSLLETPRAKRQKTEPPLLPATPRSAMKKPGDFGTSIGKSGKSVLFNTNPVSGSRDIHAHYGRAGAYSGSTFADGDPPARNDESTLSSLDYSDVISPSTRHNTLANTGVPTGYDAMIQLEKNLGAKIPQIDFSLRDPDNPSWRPSISNPRPGSFRVPYLDEEDGEMDDAEEPRTQTNTTDNTPAQPSTPRMSHAELPGSSQSLASSINPDSILFESTELALEKARSAAQKYKPKDSSRLSNVSPAISRSPSPDTHDLISIYESNESSSTPRQRVTAPAVRPIGAPPQPFVATPLDNETKGDDGMTDHEREHQHDEWAAGLDWPYPQTYEEVGTCTKDISDLIRKNWTTEDDRRSEEFWHREFELIEREQIEAKKMGKTLGFITGMEDAFMDGVLV